MYVKLKMTMSKPDGRANRRWFGLNSNGLLHD